MTSIKKPVPNGTETPFDFSELFFSTTDTKGNIVYGNEVFLRVSGYATDVIVGAPHNIVRHPAMPRAVFKLFWETLKAGHPIAAYVQNLSASGSSYWVFAFAFPIANGYLSIRFKPSSKLFDAAKEIYRRVLAEEEVGGLKASAPLLEKLVHDAGFADYTSFMVAAAIEELSSREARVAQRPSSGSDPAASRAVNSLASEIAAITRDTSAGLSAMFGQIEGLQECNVALVENTDAMRAGFGHLKSLSTNMTLLATRLGTVAAGLSVVSREFSLLSEQIEAYLEELAGFIKELSQVVASCSLHLVALKSQMTMVDFFVKESVDRSTVSADAFGGMAQNRACFCDLFTRSVSVLLTELGDLRGKLARIVATMSDVVRFIGGLEVVRQTGAVESARETKLRDGFSHYLIKMGEFTTLLKGSMGAIERETATVLSGLPSMMATARRVSGGVVAVFDLALSADSKRRDAPLLGGNLPAPARRPVTPPRTKAA